MRAFNFLHILDEQPSRAHPRMSAMILLMSIRDGADLAVIETDPTSGVIAARIGYRCGLTWYELVPCPHREVKYVFPALMPYLRLCHPPRSIWDRLGIGPHVDGPILRIGTLPLLLEKPYGEIVVTERVQGTHLSVTFQLPVLPDVQARVSSDIAGVVDESFRVEFPDTPDE